MFSIFKIQSDDARGEAQPAAPVQSPRTSAKQSEKASNDVFLDSLATLSKANGMNAVRHGARLAVIGELLVSVLTHLPASMRADIAESFRDRIEDLMSLGDDRSLPEQYHSALLTEVNRFLNALR